MGKLVVVSVFAVALSALIGQRLNALSHLALAFRELTQNHLPNCQLIKGIGLLKTHNPTATIACSFHNKKTWVIWSNTLDEHCGLKAWKKTGAEDITVLEDGLAFISSGLRYPGLPPYSDVPGKIYTLDLSSGAGLVDLHIKGDFDTKSFNPHGISIYTDEKDGARYLFVVNHPQNNSFVEIFKFLEEENALEHKKTIKHELLHNVNDIVAVGVESFYATNDHYFTNDKLQTLEFLLSLHWCDVVFYTSGAVKSVAGGFMSANGINISPDKRYLYVSDIMNHQIVVLEIQKNAILSRVKEVAVGSLCDNIDVEISTGDLWMGCHPNGAKFLRSDPNDPPGSEVIRIQNIHSEEPVVTQVFADNGSVIIGSSVASPCRGKLLIGTVYHRALQCDLK